MRAALASLLVVVACNKTPSEEQCTQLLNHLVDLEFKKAGTTGTAETQKKDLAAQRTKVLEAKTSDFVSMCTQKIARSRVECALEASDLEQVAKCDAQQ